MGTQLEMFNHDETLQRLSRLKDPLVILAKVVPFEIFREDLPKREASAKGGRPFIDSVLLLKLLFLQHLYRLSDEQLEFQTLDRLSFQRFAGIRRQRDVPDFTTVWRFRESLGPEGLERLMSKLHGLLDAIGMSAKGGQIIDATIVQVGKPRRDLDRPDVPTKQEQAHRDTDAAFTKKHGKSYRGYKLHINVDAGHGFVRTAKVTAANVHDGHQLEELVQNEPNRATQVYADAAYASAENEQMMRRQGLAPRIAIKRKAGCELTVRQREQNRSRSSIRATVEHVFARQNGCKSGGRWTRVVGLRRVSTKLLMDQWVYNFSRLGWFHRQNQERCARNSGTAQS